MPSSTLSFSIPSPSDWRNSETIPGRQLLFHIIPVSVTCPLPWNNIHRPGVPADDLKEVGGGIEKTKVEDSLELCHEP